MSTTLPSVFNPEVMGIGNEFIEKRQIVLNSFVPNAPMTREFSARRAWLLIR